MRIAKDCSNSPISRCGRPSSAEFWASASHVVLSQCTQFISPDEPLVTAHRRIFDAPEDGGQAVNIWSFAAFGCGGRIVALEYSAPDEPRKLSLRRPRAPVLGESEDDSVKVKTVTSRTGEGKLGVFKPIGFLPDRAWIADGSIQLWDSVTLQPIRRLARTSKV